MANWYEAFARLDDAIDDDKPMVVFLDEISWMGKYDPDFPGELKYAWDNRFRKHDKLVMVICGSVSTWITKNILRSKGFVGWPSLNLKIGELPLGDCRRFWGRRAGRVSASEMFDVLSVVGGVPKYLELVDPRLSAAENIRRLSFTPGGLLKEFDDIFSDVFEGKGTVNRRILDAMPIPAEKVVRLIFCCRRVEAFGSSSSSASRPLVRKSLKKSKRRFVV